MARRARSPGRSLGANGAMRIHSVALTAGGVVKPAWVFLMAIVVAATTWTTHIVASLARLAEGPVSHDQERGA